MTKKQISSIANQTKRQALRVFGIFSSILFWFIIVLISYVIIESNDLLDIYYTRKEWWKYFHNKSSIFLPGAIVSFIFYFLVVYIPERRKRRMIKNNMRKLYADVKRDINYQIIHASHKVGRRDLDTDDETADCLLTIEGFRAAFEDGREAKALSRSVLK